MNKNKKFTVAEVAEATGISKNTLIYRCRKLGIRKGNYTQICLTYNQVKQVVQYHNVRGYAVPQQKNIDELKLALKNDGYQIKKD